jgi:hypothetical protein
MTSIVEVLRTSKRALYHMACYEEQDGDTVYGVLRLRDAGRCAKCRKVIKAGPHSRSVQLALEGF